MADKKKIADEIISDDELDGVAGGTKRELYGDCAQLMARGLLPNGSFVGEAVGVLHNMGYTSYQGNRYEANVYTDKSGNTISREEFWKNFDAENGTSIINHRIRLR